MRFCWCGILLHTLEASDDKNDSFYEELECVFDQFCKYHMKIVLRHISAKVGMEDTFEVTVGNKSLHETSNDSGG
jgi:hypothetical protein